MSGVGRYVWLRQGLRMREEPLFLRRPSELELQARFYAGEFGLRWRGEGGESIEIVHPGEWNREPGPDFIGAVVRVDGQDRSGHIELDREAMDWERHGHGLNPAYGNVVLHAFFARGRRRFFTRNHRHEEIPQVCLGEGSARQSPRDVPRAAVSPARAAAAAAGEVSSERLHCLLEAAAHFRLMRKRESWLRAVELHGKAEALFQALATGLGYKNNKLPFLLTAQRVGLKRAAAPEGEALLFGVAGFLERLAFDTAAPAVRSYARALWQQWWAIRGSYDRLILPVEAWSFAAVRPANHPHRRLGALAALALQLPALEKAVEGGDMGGFLGLLEGLHHDFWEERFSLEGKCLEKPAALVGSQRAADLAANILAPACAGEQGLEILRSIRVGSPSGKVRCALAWLGWANSGKPGWLHSALAQQGLLQVWEDFPPRPAQEVLALFEQSEQEW